MVLIDLRLQWAKSLPSSLPPCLPPSLPGPFPLRTFQCPPLSCSPSSQSVLFGLVCLFWDSMSHLCMTHCDCWLLWSSLDGILGSKGIFRAHPICSLDCCLSQHLSGTVFFAVCAREKPGPSDSSKYHSCFPVCPGLHFVSELRISGGQTMFLCPESLCVGGGATI